MEALSLIWEGTMRRRKLTFYLLNGVYLVRAKSSLSGEKVKHAACFKNTMKSAARLGSASVIASTVYKQLPESWKLHSLYRTMVGIAARMLKAESCTVAEIEIALQQHLLSVGYGACKEENISCREKKASCRKQEDRCRKQITGIGYKIKRQERLSTYSTVQINRALFRRKHWFHTAPS